MQRNKKTIPRCKTGKRGKRKDRRNGLRMMERTRAMGERRKNQMETGPMIEKRVGEEWKNGVKYERDDGTGITNEERGKGIKKVR